MDNHSSTSNSNFSKKSFLLTLLTILALFIVSEVATRYIVTPCLLSPSLYRRFDPIRLSYGFDSTQSIFHECGQYTLYIGPESIRRYPTKKSPDDIRIFTLGGSISVKPDDSNYSILLQQQLQAQGTSQSYRVINGAVNGYGTTRHLVFLEQILASNQHPDLIILHPHGSNEFEDEVQLAYLNNILGVWYNKLLFRSRFFLAMKRLNQAITPDIFLNQTGEVEREAENDPARIAQWQTTYNNNIAKMCHLANEADIPIIFILRTVNPNLSDDNTFADALTHQINQETLQALADCQNVYFLNTPQFLDQLYPNPSIDTINRLFVDRSHWHTETHEIIAEQILEIIKTEKLIFFDE